MSNERAETAVRNRSGVATVIVAGGAGTRFGERKQFASLGGRNVLDHSLQTALSVSEAVVVVVPKDAIDQLDLTSNEISIVAGGATRADSVRAGLDAIPDTAPFVLVHDAARPLANVALFDRVISALRAGHDAVTPVTPVADSLRHVDGHAVDRSTLVAVQTPQGFASELLRAAHASGAEATDDATLVEGLGHQITVVDGDHVNRKLTVAADLIAAEAILHHRSQE